MRDEYYINGYQWGAYGQFIGEYIFPANKDQYDIHMPPNTTLIEPPRNLPVDKEAAWDGKSGSFVMCGSIGFLMCRPMAKISSDCKRQIQSPMTPNQ